jgi:hypothetical protein
MAEPPSTTHPAPTALGDASSEPTANLALVADAARTVRRMAADESPNAEGIKTIWHRGRRIELLSWEGKGDEIVRQELTFFGFYVEWKKTSGLKTGSVPYTDEQTDSGKQSSAMLRLDAQPKHRTLDFASHLLKNIPGRDFYAQHMLKHTNHALTVQGFDRMRTEVSKLTAFGKSSRLGNDRLTQRLTERLPALNRTPTWLIGLLLICGGVSLGAVLVMLLFGR